MKEKIALIIHNCPAHLSISNIHLVFLPQNTTSFFIQWTKVSLEALKHITGGELRVC